MDWMGFNHRKNQFVYLGIKKKKIVPEPIINEYFAAINNKYFGPEGRVCDNN